jgi:hypothetical protein
MVKIEYNKVKIGVPESWEDITLGFYETFYTEKPETARDQAALVAKICRVDAGLLLNWPVEIFNRIIGHIDFLFKDNPVPPSSRIEIEGVDYIVPIEEELSIGAWADAEDVQKKGENVLSNILAIVCRPAGEAYDYKNNEARRAMFAALPVSRILGLSAFFLHCKTELDRRTAAYTNLSQAYAHLPKSISPLLNPGGGIRLLRIWQIIKYWALMQLLRYLLQRFLRSFNTVKIKVMPKRHNIS